MAKLISRSPFHIIFYSVILFIAIIAYIFYTSNRIGTMSQRIKYEYYNRNLKGKKIDEVIKILGHPPKGIEHGHWPKLENSVHVPGIGERYSVLNYYTGIPFIDRFGFFPLGGSRIYFDEDDKAYIFKGFMD